MWKKTAEYASLRCAAFLKRARTAAKIEKKRHRTDVIQETLAVCGKNIGFLIKEFKFYETSLSKSAWEAKAIHVLCTRLQKVFLNNAISIWKVVEIKKY